MATQEEGLTVSHSLKVPLIMAAKAWQQEGWGSWWHCIRPGKRETELALCSLSGFYSAHNTHNVGETMPPTLRSLHINKLSLDMLIHWFPQRFQSMMLALKMNHHHQLA